MIFHISYMVIYIAWHNLIQNKKANNKKSKNRNSKNYKIKTSLEYFETNITKKKIEIY